MPLPRKSHSTSGCNVCCSLSSAEKPRAYQLSLGAQTEVALHVTATNMGESAYEAQMFIVHPASLNYVSHKAQVGRVEMFSQILAR